MTRKTILVVVGPSGEIKIEAVGFAGADCEKATAYLEQALGVIKVRQKKPEYYRRTLQQQQQVGQ